MNSIFNISITWAVALEFIAMLSGIACVYLQTKEKIQAWFFGIISVGILIVLFYNNKLYSDFILHIFLLILNIYGWWIWSNKKKTVDAKAPILLFKNTDWILWSLIIIGISPIWGYLMNTFFNASLAYLDAFTTVGSLVAQYLLAKKYLENWLIWIIVDVVAIGVYTYKELYFVAFLFFVYLILCTLGWYKWKKALNKTPSPI